MSRKERRGNLPALSFVRPDDVLDIYPAEVAAITDDHFHHVRCFMFMAMTLTRD